MFLKIFLILEDVLEDFAGFLKKFVKILLDFTGQTSAESQKLSKKGVFDISD